MLLSKPMKKTIIKIGLGATKSKSTKYDIFNFIVYIIK